LNPNAKLKTFFVVGVIAAFFASFSFCFAGFAMNNGSEMVIWEMIQVFLAYWLFMLPFVLLAGLLVAMPISAMLVKYGVRGALVYAIVGGIAGVTVSCGILGGLAFEKSTHVLIWAASIGLLPGCVAGITWWRWVDRFQLRSSFDDGNKHA
jgi:hypothetical protein